MRYSDDHQQIASGQRPATVSVSVAACILGQTSCQGPGLVLPVRLLLLPHDRAALRASVSCLLVTRAIDLVARTSDTVHARRAHGRAVYGVQAAALACAGRAEGRGLLGAAARKGGRAHLEPDTIHGARHAAHSEPVRMQELRAWGREGGRGMCMRGAAYREQRWRAATPMRYAPAPAPLDPLARHVALGFVRYRFVALGDL